MAGKLPFLVEPRREPILEKLGDEESGIIEMKRLGYLTVSEKAFMQQANNNDTTVLEMHRLAARVGKERGVMTADVIKAMSTGELEEDLFEGFENELAAVVASMSSLEDRRKLIAVTGMVIFRIDPEWGVDDTMNLHPDLVDAIYELFLEEDRRSLEAFKAIEQKKQADESAGK